MRMLAPTSTIMLSAGAPLSLMTERRARLDALAGLLILGGFMLLGASLGGIP